MVSERKIPRFWVTSERRGSEWRREAGDGREGRLAGLVAGWLVGWLAGWLAAETPIYV